MQSSLGRLRRPQQLKAKVGRALDSVFIHNQPVAELGIGAASPPKHCSSERIASVQIIVDPDFRFIDVNAVKTPSILNQPALERKRHGEE